VYKPVSVDVNDGIMLVYQSRGILVHTSHSSCVRVFMHSHVYYLYVYVSSYFEVSPSAAKIKFF